MAHIPCENFGVEAIRTPGDRDATTSRRHPFPSDLAGELKAARLAAGWGIPKAAKAVQLDPPMLPSSWWLIEQGRRAPSTSVMEAILRVLPFPSDVAARFRAAAILGVGRDRRLLRAQRRAENRAAWAAALNGKSVRARPPGERKAPREHQAREQMALREPTQVLLLPACPVCSRPFGEFRDRCFLGHRWNGP